MSDLLSRIHSPDDLKRLTPEDLPKVAVEMREFLIRSVSRTGGHLGASLGTVELTLALHYVFDTPRDRLVWDTGHQAYGHKILTGRRERFSTLRQAGGLCGFPKRSESEYDTFAVGHAGTALSAAFGMARARDLLGKDFRVVAVVGDAAISNGLSMEAMNNIGHHRQTDFTVILNDNKMSISPNVGAMSAYLNKILMGRSVQSTKNRLEALLDRIPNVGPQMLRMAHHAEETLKGFVTPGTLFEELGFRYYGPVDGHDVRNLVNIFRRLRELKGPVLLHVITEKGRGYAPAEAHPERFHGVSVFDPETGKAAEPPAPGPPTYTQVFSNALMALAERDSRIVALTAGMPSGTGLKAFSERFPERFHDVGIAEGHAVTMAAGLACEGLRPVVAIYSTFLQRAYDQVIHDVCLQNLPVVFAVDRAGAVGEDGETHMGAFDLSYLRCVPNLTVMAPADENELGHMLYTALRLPGPSAVRYPRGAAEGAPIDSEFRDLPVGRGVELSTGSDFALLAVGRMVGVARRAAEELSAEGLSGTVANLRFVKPLDGDLVERVARRTGAVLTLEENAAAGGFGSAVLECLARRGVSDCAVRVLGFPDAFIAHGTPTHQREACGLEPRQVAQAVRDLLASRPPSMLGAVNA